MRGGFAPLSFNGNQKSKTSNGETTNYVYDKMNRLIRENDTVYTFDDFGNRKTMTSGDTTTTYTYDLNNRLTESNEVTGDSQINTQYFYDANGNQTIKAIMSSEVYDGASAGHTVSDDTNEYLAIYDYNCYNQLVGVDANGVVSSYTYFPDGMRATKTVGDDTTTFVYDGANIIEEITPDDTNVYYRGLEIVKNSDGLCYLYNGQGDVAMLVDSTGNTVANYTFDAYGNTDSENTVYNPFGYRGEYLDAESGLIYLRARMYDPSTGRFINEDPVRDGLNWYIYCGGNPIMFVDPNGTDAIFLTNTNAVNSGDYIGDTIGRDVYLGHTAVIVQNTDGEWYYFSWGKDYVDFIKVDSWALESLDNFNYWLGIYKYDYTSSTYIGGDFSESVKYFDNLASSYVDEDGEKLERGTKNSKYDAIFNNCLQTVLMGLYKGTLADGKTSFQSYISLNTFIPNSAQKIISNAFYNDAFTYEEYHKKINDQLWEAKNGDNKSWFKTKKLERIIK